MAHRAADFKTAQKIVMAVDLARCGASSVVIERMTGFGPRWVRGIVLENGGAFARKPKDPLRWFQEDLQRLLHAHYVVMAYECQPANLPPSKRLLEAYRAYRAVAQNPGLLGVNECAQIVDLYQSGNACVRTCSKCRMEYLVLSEQPCCPLCRMIAREFCKGCGKQLNEPPGSLKAYCDQCSPRSVRAALKRKEHVGDTQLRFRGGGISGVERQF